MDEQQVSPLSHMLLTAYEAEELAGEQGYINGNGASQFEGKKKIRVNPVVSEVASWYEKLRTSMDYRADEVVLRGAIERILKRRVLLGGDGEKIAPPLVRELIWARYFPDATVPEAIIEQVSYSINLYLTLFKTIEDLHMLPQRKLDEWLYHLLSSDLEHILNPNTKEDTMRNFMFQILKDHVVIADDTQETRDAQVFLAVSRAFANDDIAFLRYHLFGQFFGEISFDNLSSVADGFVDFSDEANKQLRYPLKDRIYAYVKNQTPPFLILRDILHAYAGDISELLYDTKLLDTAVFAACEGRYKSIVDRVRRAIVRSILFILLTKSFLAFALEGAYETYRFGQISFVAMAINISIPPLLMVIVALLIKTPDTDNSNRILERIHKILFAQNPQLAEPLVLKLQPENIKPFQEVVFRLFWFLAFALSFGAMFFALRALGFHLVSIGVFAFFLTIVAFLSYRISQTATIYTIEYKQTVWAPIADFLFLPIIQVGRHLTQGISQLNLVLFVFDFLIETPFKGLFAFFEQWFLFLHAKREQLG